MTFKLFYKSGKKKKNERGENQRERGYGGKGEKEQDRKEWIAWLIFSEVREFTNRKEKDCSE